MEKQISLFDAELNKNEVVRSNKRRVAVIIAKQEGAKMMKKIHEELDKAIDEKNQIKQNFKVA